MPRTMVLTAPSASSHVAAAASVSRQLREADDFQARLPPTGRVDAEMHVSGVHRSLDTCGKLRGPSNPLLLFNTLQIFSTLNHVLQILQEPVRLRKSLQVILNALGNIEVNGKHVPWLNYMHVGARLFVAVCILKKTPPTPPAAAGEGDSFQAGQLSADEMGLRSLKHML